MIRRSRKSAAADDVVYAGSIKKDDGKNSYPFSSSSLTPLSSPSSSSSHNQQQGPLQSNSPSPIIPPWLLCFIVTSFLFMGFASEHYNRTRAEDHYERSSHSSNSGRALNIQTNDYLGKVVATSSKSLISATDDEALEYENGQRYHVIFSTDCSPYQHWQSFLVYYSAMKVRQPGHVTRIVSGCDPDEAVAMKEWFQNSVQFMSKRFHLHMTPKFSEVKDQQGNVIGEYSFFNKPHGLKHFLEHFDRIGFHDSGNPSTATFEHEDDIVILVDPDMVLMRPITKDFSDDRDTLITQRRKDHILSREVSHGVPFAQTYGLGVQWQKFDLDKIAGENSPAKEVSRESGQLYFPVGPPYIGTVRDMYQIAVKWSEFVPLVHAQYPYLLAEMYAFCIAAAHLGLRHQIIDSLMISNPDTGGEGWPLIDKIPAEDMCDFARDPDHRKYALPSVVHMCQRYSVGKEWFFGKRRIPHDIYECETPLFEEPPSNLGVLYDFKWPPNAKDKTLLSPKIINQQTFMVCALTRLLNDASQFYKSATCSEGRANVQQSRKVADLFREGNKKQKKKS